jgi:hypothetical protein
MDSGGMWRLLGEDGPDCYYKLKGRTNRITVVATDSLLLGVTRVVAFEGPERE